jgi:hypothetical protein
VLESLRARILSGAYRVGSRLPTRAELVKRYATTAMTMQRVFDRLEHEGFVVSRGQRGTFVSDSPPHLSSFVMVFPSRDRPDRPRSLFLSALEAEATRRQRPGMRIAFSYGNETHQDVEAYRQLVDDVAEHRVAGLFFATNPHYLAGSPVLEMPGIPRVAVMAAPNIPGVKALTHAPGWTERAIELAQRHARRRVAALGQPSQEPLVARALAAAGLEAPPYWFQSVDLL